MVYLMLVNNLLHDLFPNAITVGEWRHGTERHGAAPHESAKEWII